MGKSENHPDVSQWLTWEETNKPEYPNSRIASSIPLKLIAHDIEFKYQIKLITHKVWCCKQKIWFSNVRIGSNKIAISATGSKFEFSKIKLYV